MEKYILVNKILNSIHLFNRVLDFIYEKKCLSCHNIVNNNLINIKFNKYWDYDWKKNRCFKSDSYSVCNWCYHYVWEYN